MGKNYIKVMLPALLLLTLSLSGCARLTPRYLTDKERVWVVPKGAAVKTTEGVLTTDEEMILGYKGHLFQVHITANDETLKK